MGAIAEATTELVHDVYDFIEDAVKLVWDYAIMPALEIIFGWFGVTDEDVIMVKSVSLLMYEIPDRDLVKQAYIRIALDKASYSNATTAPFWLAHVGVANSRFRKFQRYGENHYTEGLPELQINVQVVPEIEIIAAIESEIGPTVTILTSQKRFATEDEYYKWYLQNNYAYLPYNNSLTYTNSNGDTYSDYDLKTITYNATNLNYDITFSRIAELCIFSVIGDSGVIEGETTGNYLISLTREVPTGESVIVNLSYSGTAVDGVDYTSLASVVIPGLASSGTFTIPTIENAATDIAREFTVAIASITNTNTAFEAVSIHLSRNQVTTVIHDDEEIILTISNQQVAEDAGSVAFNVTLTKATAAAFTVDYAFTDGSAVNGLDYTGVNGTLNFAGTLNEIQTITVPILTDVLIDDYEDFSIALSNCSDPLVDTSIGAICTIVDNTDIPDATVVVEEAITAATYTSVPYVFVTYYKTIAAEWFYWLYDETTLVHPNVTVEYVTTNGLEMLPMVLLREQNISITSDRSTEQYRTSKSMLRRIGLKIEDIVDSLEASPDIGLIRAAYLSYGVNPIDTIEVIPKVLYEMFNYLTSGSITASDANYHTAHFEEGSIHKALAWKDEIAEVITGVIGDIGTYYHSVTGQTLVMEKQLSATEYARITITTLSSIDFVYKASSGAGWDTAVSELGSEDFNIPLSYFVVHELSYVEQLELYSYALRLNMYAVDIIHLEWYETEAFANLIGVVFQAIGLALTIMTLGAAKSWVDVLLAGLYSYIASEAIGAVAAEIDNPYVRAAFVIAASWAVSEYADTAIGVEFTTAETLLNIVTDFSTEFAKYSNEQIEQIMAENDKMNQLYEERYEELEEKYKKSSISTAYITYMKSVDTLIYESIAIQYDFEQVYSYDTLLSNFHSNNLRLSVN